MLVMKRSLMEKGSIRSSIVCELISMDMEVSVMRKGERERGLFISN